MRNEIYFYGLSMNHLDSKMRTKNTCALSHCRDYQFCLRPPLPMTYAILQEFKRYASHMVLILFCSVWTAIPFLACLFHMLELSSVAGTHQALAMLGTASFPQRGSQRRSCFLAETNCWERQSLHQRERLAERGFYTWRDWARSAVWHHHRCQESCFSTSPV